MATIGLDKLYYSKITEDADGNETYATPTQLAKAMTADLSVELAEATLYADDGAAEIVKEFKSGTLSLGIDDLGADSLDVFQIIMGVEEEFEIEIPNEEAEKIVTVGDAVEQIKNAIAG